MLVLNMKEKAFSRSRRKLLHSKSSNFLHVVKGGAMLPDSLPVSYLPFLMALVKLLFPL